MLTTYDSQTNQMYLFPMEKFAGVDIYPRDTKKWRNFLRFHKAHPEAYEDFVRLAKEAKERGFTSLGAHLLIQRMRWECQTGKNENKYKVCNNHFPYYARIFILDHPEFEGFFELRKLKE